MSAPANLVTIRKGVTLQADAAASFQRIEARAGRAVDVNDTYRDYDEQQRKYDAYLAYLAGRGPWAPLALPPDKSMHCRGLALDTDDHAILRDSRDYGWRSTVSTEPWHFDYIRSTDKHLGEPAGGDSKPLPTPIPPPTPAPPTEEDEDMQAGQVHTKYPNAKYTRRALFVPGTPYFFEWDANDATLANAWSTLFKTAGSTEVTPGVMDAMRAHAKSLI